MKSYILFIICNFFIQTIYSRMEDYDKISFEKSNNKINSIVFKNLFKINFPTIPKPKINLPELNLPEINLPEKNLPKLNLSKIEEKVENFYDNLTDFKINDEETEGNCYNNIGCFSNKYPWFSFLRPLPNPESPEKIDIKLYLYTRSNNETSYSISLQENLNISDSKFDQERPYTVFITHGFSNDGNSTWMYNLKTSYLKKRDANIFLVDWGKGAKKANYLQVASNTRIVGAELARFGKYLITNYNLNLKNIHLIGHSLGSHISAYFAKNININNTKISQITALDPAQPAFEKCSEEVRLNKGDADFIEVLHTNTRPIIPTLGFGFIEPIGDNDYYFNGGLIQPGCKTPSLPQNVSLKSIKDLLNIPVETISDWIGCSHGRSYLYYTEAIDNDNCTFWGRQSNIIGNVVNILSLGKSEDIIQKIKHCNEKKCSKVGLNSKDNPLRGVFLISTHSSSPFCKIE